MKTTQPVNKPDLMLQVDALSVHFPVKAGLVKAVDGISLTLGAGEIVGLVGESGSGKSTVGKAILGLTKATSGKIAIDGVELTTATDKELNAIRTKAQLIFQDPHSSLNPRMTIKRIVAEPLVIHTRHRGKLLRDTVTALLDRVGLPAQFQDRFPHELSGGQKQRVAIARALAVDPGFLVLDEPTSALDVSVQAQILDFLKELHHDRPRMTSLFISHNLAVVRYLCQRVAVMYLGKIVEQGPVEEVFSTPQHPYTKALLSSVPLPQATQELTRIVLSGELPSPVDRPSGCAFHPRCPEIIDGLCNVKTPPLQVRASSIAYCHIANGE